MDYNLSPVPKTKENVIFLKEEKASRDRGLKNIFDNFSQESLLTIKEACDLAKNENKLYVSPWHILSVLAKKADLSTKISIESLNSLNTETVKVLANQKSGDYFGKVFFSPEVKKVLFAAYFISKQQLLSSVTNLHILSALSVYPDMVDLFTSIGFVPITSENFYIPKSLSDFATDLTSLALSTNKTYPSRETELSNVTRILARENKHNIILFGDEGVGKSVIGNGLASFLITNKFPGFSGTRVISLNIGSLFSLTSGSIGNITNIAEEVSSMGRVVFFLENASLLTSSVQMSQFIDFVQGLDKKGNVFFIMPVTPSFYKEYILQNPYLNSYFEVIKIEELSEGSAEEIIASEAARIEKYYRLTIDPTVFSEVVTLSKRYLTGKLPQKAITLLEEVCAGVSLKEKATVTIEDVRDVVSQKTGIPLNSITESETEKLKNLESIIAKSVVGQSDAITRVSESLRRARAGLKDARKPIGSFLFLGPTGVGKTELAKTLAKLFFNDDKSFIRFDMSEYAESHTAQRLIGAPPGYVGYEEGGQLTNQVIGKPYCLILFDEIEKAHPRVFDLFLQILDDGRLTDSQGHVVDFRNTLIIFTSNIASPEIFANGGSLSNPSFDKKAFYDKVIMPRVREYFRPELVNRFDDIVMFNPLTRTELVSIAKIKIMQLQEKLKSKNITFVISDARLTKLVEDSFDPANGARPLEREIKDKIENDLAKRIINGEIKEGEKVNWE